MNWILFDLITVRHLAVVVAVLIIATRGDPLTVFTSGMLMMHVVLHLRSVLLVLLTVIGAFFVAIFLLLTFTHIFILLLVHTGAIIVNHLVAISELFTVFESAFKLLSSTALFVLLLLLAVVFVIHLSIAVFFS